MLVVDACVLGALGVGVLRAKVLRVLSIEELDADVSESFVILNLSYRSLRNTFRLFLAPIL